LDLEREGERGFRRRETHALGQLHRTNRTQVDLCVATVAVIVMRRKKTETFFETTHLVVYLYASVAQPKAVIRTSEKQPSPSFAKRAIQSDI